MSEMRLDKLLQLDRKPKIDISTEYPVFERKDLDFTEILWDFFLGLEPQSMPELFNRLFRELSSGKLKPPVSPALISQQSNSHPIDPQIEFYGHCA